MNVKKWTFLVTLLLTLAACGDKPMTEAEQYAELQEGFKYRTYTKLSEAGIPALVDELNRQHRALAAKAGTPYADEDDIPQELARLGLAVLWLLQMKGDLGIAESNLIVKTSATDTDRYIGSALLSLGMYQNRWPGLALETNTRARESISDKALADMLYEKQVMLYLSLGMLAIQERDAKTAHFAFSGLGAATGVTWMADSSEAIMLLEEGKTQEGLIKLKELANNPTLPERERQEVLALLAEVESKIGKVEGPFFWPRVLGHVLLKRIMETDTSRLKALFQRLEEFRNSAG